MKTIAALLSMLLICSTGLSAHNTISGTITDNYGNAIYYTTVVLFSTEDSNIVKMVATDMNGNYTFEDIADGDYFIEANMLSHIPMQSENISFPKNNKAVVNLTLSVYEVELPLIEVVAERPEAFEQVNNKDIGITEEIATFNDNLMDVMRKVFDDILVTKNTRLADSKSVCNQKDVKVCCQKN